MSALPTCRRNQIRLAQRRRALHPAVAILLAAMLVTLWTWAALAADISLSPAPESRSVRFDGDSWTPDSYPEIWLIPRGVMMQALATGGRFEYLCFPPLELTVPHLFSPSWVEYGLTDSPLCYSYQLESVKSAENRWKAWKYNMTLVSQQDGITLYDVVDKRHNRPLAVACLEVPGVYSQSYMLDIDVWGLTKKQDAKTLRQACEAEARRVASTMRSMTLDHHWSDGVYSNVELKLSKNNKTVVVDTRELMVTEVWAGKMALEKRSGDRHIFTVVSMGVTFDPASVTQAALADGTPYLLQLAYDYSRTAYFDLSDDQSGSQGYLAITHDGPVEDFPAELEKMYARVRVVP